VQNQEARASHHHLASALLPSALAPFLHTVIARWTKNPHPAQQVWSWRISAANVSNASSFGFHVSWTAQLCLCRIDSKGMSHVPLLLMKFNMTLIV
jgi:hypothetical protein